MMTMGCLESQDLHHAPGGGGGDGCLLDDLSAAVAGDGDDFDAMEIWLEGGVDHHQEHRPHDFPPLPAAGDYYPCISSSSSTSSAPAPGHPKPSCSSSASSSSSSAASWAFLKSDPEDLEPAANKIHLPSAYAPSAAAASSFDPTPLPEESFTEDDCIDVLDNLGYMDDFITGDTDLWENCSIFPTTAAAPEECQTAMAAEAKGEIITYHEEEEEKKEAAAESPELPFLQGNGELAAIFFDWLKQNKDHISAEDMRSIKLKRSTIETASKRLGTSKEGKKQLLKLILDWVQQYQLQKKLRSGGQADEAEPLLLPPPPGDDGACFYLPPPFTPSDPVGHAHPPPFSVFHPPQHYVAADSYGNYGGGVSYCHFHQQMDSNQSWPSSSEFPASSQPFATPFPDNEGNTTVASEQGGYPFPLLDVVNGERVGSSATKEARKKRMARQRRLAGNHHHHFRHQNNNTMRLAGAVENCGVVLPLHRHQAINSNNFGNWMYWSPAAVSDPRPPPPPMVVEAPQPPQAERQPPVPVAQPHHQNNNPKQGSSERRQGTKTEKNLRFLLQKVLKQSDVGSLGRIVLPKKEAETQLPELESRDGISIAMEDIGTSRVWNMKYRFWPNNKSRMYLLENTGDFVRANALQEGDFIVIYADTKSGKYVS
ncbi:unnamed protein product [Cuscuta campestris]|uniref:TF-B3 domain-containing protein n=1 Tax=Cuscuta campestris TaxID=132261 RepID=A0A484NGN0_9ASTE|nr:unnamed protein product [Cuscuta campestris]